MEYLEKSFIVVSRSDTSLQGVDALDELTSLAISAFDRVFLKQHRRLRAGQSQLQFTTTWVETRSRSIQYRHCPSMADLKPCPHRQQCPSNIVECYKWNDSFDKVERCFYIVAGNNVEATFDFVESTLLIRRRNRSTCSIRQCCFDSVAGADGA